MTALKLWTWRLIALPCVSLAIITVGTLFGLWGALVHLKDEIPKAWNDPWPK